MATDPDPIQQLLAEIRKINETNAAAFLSLQDSLAKQEARHHDDMNALRKEFEERVSEIRSAARTPEVTDTAKNRPTPDNTKGSGSGLPPSSPILPAPVPTSTERSERLPDPPVFTGKKKDLPLFLTKLQFKLEGNADRYASEQSRLIYAHSRLDYDPATLVDPLIGRDITTVKQLVDFLQATYGDPNRELTAWSRLDNLRQGKKGFIAHFADFRRLVADTSLNEGAQINHLRRSLSDELRRAMVGVPIPTKLNDYANLIALYDNDLRHLPTSHPTRPRLVPVQKRDPDAMEIDNNYAPVGSKEREDRMKKGLCFKCGKHGHISRDCSVPLPHARSNSIPTRTRSTTPTNRTRRNSDSSSSMRGSPRRSRHSRSRRSSRKDSSRG